MSIYVKGVGWVNTGIPTKRGRYKKRNHIDIFNKSYVVNELNDCWEWQLYLSPLGYGRFTITTEKIFSAHRASYFLHVGSIPKGLNICHHCDNPKCVNPNHLFLGTQKQNIHDAMSKNRYRGRVKIFKDK